MSHLVGQSFTETFHTMRNQGTKRKWSRLAAAMIVYAASSVVLPTVACAEATEAVDFVRDIQPIFVNHCYECHDGGLRRGGLRLDLKEQAMLGGDHGPEVIVPGKPDESMLIQLVRGDNPALVMPAEGDRLSDKQIALLTQWIAQGATWPDGVDVESNSLTHWAYIAPQRPALPEVKQADWPRNAIDYFVLARLEQEGLHPTPEANRYTLIRRVSLDLRGLPPTPEEVQQFVSDPSDNAYEQMVDRMLASPAYGERWARLWLDMARFADSQGYEKDSLRTIWRYRDWVIQAFNDDMPFDQFTVEQIAGDLLPDPTLDQMIATAFHRNTMTNAEGGTDDEEFRVAAVVDRVNTTGQIWMATTIGCAQCHSHKYDPISQREFFQFYAFFNQTLDNDQTNEHPTMLTPTAAQQSQMKQLEARIGELQTSVVRELAALHPDRPWQDSDALAAVHPPTRVLEILVSQPEARSDVQHGVLDDFLARVAGAHEVATALRQTRSELAAINPPTTPIMRELPPDKQRETRIHVRGSFLTLGDRVEPGMPEVLHPMSQGAPMNRLGAAQWLVSRDNPLTARVTVNRFWAHLFAFGLVETTEDFGTRGAKPSHPQLLDYLAIEFMDNGWSMKQLLKQIVMSATYRQDSRVTAEMSERDPRNALLSRGPRFRLEAEMIRDQALAAAGLLSEKMFGPSVMPPQPPGIWNIVYSGDKWVTSTGEDRYRRAVYTLIRRTTPYPSLMTFDGTSREICVERRIRTNTPLQALVTLNDPVYIEAAQALARRMVSEGGDTPSEQVAHGIKLTLNRNAKDEEVARLIALYENERAVFTEKPEEAKQFATDPLGPLPEGMAPADLAAWTVVANVLLNLDETLTKK